MWRSRNSIAHRGLSRHLSDKTRPKNWQGHLLGIGHHETANEHVLQSVHQALNHTAQTLVNPPRSRNFQAVAVGIA